MKNTSSITSIGTSIGTSLKKIVIKKSNKLQVAPSKHLRLLMGAKLISVVPPSTNSGNPSTYNPKFICRPITSYYWLVSTINKIHMSRTTTSVNI